MQTGSLKFPCAWLVTLLGLIAVPSAQAQAMADPTRPAPAWLAMQAQGPSSEPVAEPVSLDVQIVVIGPERKFAMVNGQTVRPGETYRGSKLVAINEDGAVWRRDGVTERSSMSPGVSKKIMGAEPMAGKAKAKKKPVNGEGQ